VRSHEVRPSSVPQKLELWGGQSTLLSPSQNFGEDSPSLSPHDLRHCRKVPQQRTEIRGETILNRGTHNRESPCLSGGCASKWHHKVTSGGRAERSAKRARQSKDKAYLICKRQR